METLKSSLLSLESVFCGIDTVVELYQRVTMFRIKRLNIKRLKRAPKTGVIEMDLLPSCSCYTYLYGTHNFSFIKNTQRVIAKQRDFP